MVQNFRKTAENHMNGNFCDKNFVIATFFRDYRCAAYVHTSARDIQAQNVAMPTIIQNFREENFRDQKSNHEIHKNIVPRKFAAIRYVLLE